MAPLQQMSQVAHLVVLFVQFVQNFSTLAIYWAVMCLKTTAVRGAQNSEGKVCLGPQFSKCFSWPSRTIEKSETKLLEFDLTLVCSCKAGRIWNLNESRDYRFTTRLQYKAHHPAPASHIRLLFRCCNALICSCDPFIGPPIFAFLWINWPKERVARLLNIVNYCFFFVFMSSQSGRHNLRSFLGAYSTQNYFLIARMLSFLWHSRQKCRI